MQYISLIDLIGDALFDHRLSSFPKMDVGRDVVRGSRREIAREFEFEHTPVSWMGEEEGCLLDNNWEDGSIVQIPRCKWAVLHERFGSHLNAVAATIPIPRGFIRVRYKRGVRYLLRVIGFSDFWLRDYLDLVAYGISFQSIIEWIIYICTSFPSLKPGLYILFPEKLLNIVH